MTEITVLTSIGYLASILLILFVVISSFGFDFEADVSSDLETDSGDSYGAFTFKNLLGFLAGFGLVSSYLLGEDYSLTMSLIGGVVSGLIMAGVLMLLMYFSNKLDQDTVTDYTKLEGHITPLYLGMQAGNLGKILVDVDGSTKEFLCYTNRDESLLTGSRVTLIEYKGNNTFLVNKTNN